jgi:hypothetical protein
MTDFESRLRTALQTIEPPAADRNDGWNAVATQLDGTSVFDHESLDVYLTETVELRHSMNRTLAVAAALLLIAGGLGVLASNGRNAPVRVAAPPDLPRLLLDPAPEGTALQSAVDGIQTIHPDGFTIGLRSSTEPVTTVAIEAWPDSLADEAGDAVPVRGVIGRMTITPETSSLMWQKGTDAIRIEVNGNRAADRAFLLDIADRVSPSLPPNTDGISGFSLSTAVPGFRQTYSGSQRELMPAGGYQISYQASGTVDPSTPLLTLTVDQRGLSIKQQADIFGMTPIAINNGRGYIGDIGYGVHTWAAPNTRMLLMQVDSTVVKLSAVNLPESALMAAAKSIRKVPIQDWTRQLGARITRLMAPVGSSGTPVAATNSALLPTASEVLERQAKASVCFSKSGVPSKARSDGSLEIGIGEQSESDMSPALADPDL